MSSPSRKRQKLTSPKPPIIAPDIEIVPISDESDAEEDDRVIPVIVVEDISDDSDSESSKPFKLKRETVNSPVNSPMKILSQANLFENLNRSGVVMSQPSTSKFIEISKAESSQSNIISTTTTMLSPFSNSNQKATLGSPKYMVQEVSSTVVTDKRFLLTSLNTDTKERLRLMIKLLGGHYIDSPNFVANCTHIVLGKPNTGEKYMGGLITGKWLLRIDYIEESYSQGYWLEEEAFEWSTESISRVMPNTDTELAKLSSAARRCRLRYNGDGPFQGMTSSILSNHPRRQECYERLFKSGGGRVINIQDYKKRHNELSFILVDNPDQTHIPLKNPSVPLLRINYIHNMVLEADMPDISGYKVKKELAPTQLPTVPWISTFSNVRKHINLTSKKCPYHITEFIKTSLDIGHGNSILLPLAINQSPAAEILASRIKHSLLPATSVVSLRQCMSDLYILSWFIAPTNVNRDYYMQLLDHKAHGTVQAAVRFQQDAFIELIQDGVKKDGSRAQQQSPRYLIWWLALLEKDFFNWERRPLEKPLVEKIMNSWHYTRKQLRVFLKAYHTVMVSDSTEDLKMAMNSLLIVYFTSHEMKRKVKKQELDKASTMDLMADNISGVVKAMLRLRDIRRIHVLLHMLSFSSTLTKLTINKVLVSFNNDLVPEHYRCLLDRAPSWEKFCNFYLHVRYDDPDTTDPGNQNVEMFLILLCAIFRSLLSEDTPPDGDALSIKDKLFDFEYEINSSFPSDKTTAIAPSPASSLMMNILTKIVVEKFK